MDAKQSPAQAALAACHAAADSEDSTPAVIARRRLSLFASDHKDTSIADLLDWYKDDLNALGEVPIEQFKLIVEDYRERREFYRRQN